MYVINILKILLVLILFAGIQACGTDSNAGDDELGTFEVPFEIYVPATQMDDGSWHISSGGFAATFKARENVQSYEFRVVRENGTKGDAFTRNLNQLQQDGDQLSLVVMIGTPTFYFGATNANKDQVIEDYRQKLIQHQQAYHKLEVTTL